MGCKFYNFSAVDFKVVMISLLIFFLFLVIKFFLLVFEISFVFEVIVYCCFLDILGGYFNFFFDSNNCFEHFIS